MIRPIAPQPSLTEIAADRIRDAIISGALQLGENISEDRLVARLEISRTPIRDAMALLSKEGLVTVRPKRGTFVFETSPEDIGAICVYREVLETQGMRIALETARAPFLRELDAIVSAMERALEGDATQDYTRLDTRFHQCAFDFCGNSYLRDAYGLIAGRIAALRANITAPYAERRAESMDEHRRMSAMLGEGDLPALDATLAVHIRRTGEVYSKALADGHLGGLPATGRAPGAARTR
jgi:DNA-binding GntR family transcriptional regulator